MGVFATAWSVERAIWGLSGSFGLITLLDLPIEEQAALVAPLLQTKGGDVRGL